MKTKEELKAIQAEVETLRGKLAELSAEELEQVVGGRTDIDTRKDLYENIILAAPPQEHNIMFGEM